MYRFQKQKQKQREKPKDYSWLWWVVIIGGFWLYGQFTGSSSNTDTPQYPLDQTSDSADYLADTMEDYSRTYDPGESYDLEPDYDSPSDYYDDNSSGCPNGCAVYTAGCDIKGNISYTTGGKIYHMPGQKYYSPTTIDPAYGERWFCTEAEAQASGWRKSSQ